jgi:peptidoglycan/xylan/chitin deacetylase (PgdA/CDA1 family)
VAYGGDGIFQCVTPGTVALTFDDGPQSVYTDHILDLFKSYNAKATFFMTGNNINKGQIDIKHAEVIKRVDAEGHQVASHTWTHLDLSKISSFDRKNQMWMNEMALRNVLGKIPTYMRPPYSSCTAISGCQQDLADLGYHITNFKVDTDDYNQITPDKIQASKDWFKGNITKDGASADKGAKWLSISHDILEQTANNLTEYMLSTLTQLGYKAVTVGECLGDPKVNWYRSADGTVANITQVSTPSR